MKYIVTIEEWENNQKLYRNLGLRDGLNFFEYAIGRASWGETKEVKNEINRFIYEQNPCNKPESICHKVANPMLTIISGLRIYCNIVNYLIENNPKKLEELCKKAEV